MRSFDIPTSKAKLKLLDAAENLIAENGFDAVSVRDVTQMAKANVAAVNYHFGSREGMMGLMMFRRMSPVHEERLKNLDLLEKKRGSKAVPLEELLEAWLRPLFLDSDKDDEAAMIRRRSVARILQLEVDELPQPLQESGLELWARYLKAYSKCLKEIPAQEIAWRLHLLNGAAHQSLMGISALKAWVKTDDSGANAGQSLSRLLRLAAPMMREGGVMTEQEAKQKGPQETFDF